MKRLTLALFVILLASSSRRAAASDVSWGRVATNASYVYLKWFWLGANTTTTFTTTALEPQGADTMMYLLQGDTQTQVAKNDDYGGTLASQITYTAPSQGKWYILVVRSYSTGTAGTCLVLKNGVPTEPGGARASFAGQPVSIGPATPTTGSSIRTAERAGGVTDTVLFGFDGSQNLRAINDDDWAGSGRRSDNVGRMSRLEPMVVFTSVVIGTYSAGDSGPVWLIVNDVNGPNLTLDEDNDGLGKKLEAALCTCDSPSQNDSCGLPCTGLATTTDSDGDGIPDDWEVYGANALWNDPHGKVQPLARWGANPAHKDVFVEVDRHYQTLAVTPNALADAQTPYLSVGSASQLANRDGVAGVALHFDIGPTGAGCTSTLCGDWGGSQELPPTGSSYKAPSDSEFIASRRGIFHYAHSKPSGSGQSDGEPSIYFITNTGAATIAHELGHNVGLGHGGRKTAANYNGKPNYHSLMNYAFAFSPGAAFSQGAWPSLNPMSLSEVNGLYTSTCTELAHIDGINTSHNYLVAQGPQYCAIDWNRDGVINPDPVEAAPNLQLSPDAEPELGRYYWEWEQTPAFMRDSTARPDPTATPSLARVGARLYVAHRHDADGRIWLTWTDSAFGGCADPSKACPTTVWHQDTLPSLDLVASPGAGPALVTTLTGHLMVVFRNAAGIHYRVLTPSHTIFAQGTIAGTSDAHNEPVVGVGPYGEPRLIFRRGLGTPGEVYMSTFSSVYQTWSAPAVQQDAAGQPLLVHSVNALAPGMAPGGQPELHMVVTEDHPTTSEIVLSWYRLNTGTGRWEGYPVYITKVSAPLAKRVGLAFRVNKNNGAASHGGRYYLIHTDKIGVLATGNKVPALWMTRGDTGTGSRLDWIFTSYFDNTERSTTAGVSLLGWERVTRFEPNLRYVGLFGTTVDTTAIDFMPFADGIIPIILEDSKDWEVMERGICAALQSGYCNGTGSACKSCVGTENPTIQW